jgi:hypothetical protein
MIGNSHVGAVKSAWDEMESLQERPADLSITFFASVRDRMARLVERDGVLVGPPGIPQLTRHMEMTSGGIGAIVPGDYDFFVIHALLFRVPQLEEELSSQVCVQACSDAFDASANSTVARLVRSVSDKPIIVTPVPLRSNTRRSDLTSRFISYANTSNLVAQAIAPDFVFVGQPAETIGHPWITRERYAKDARALVTGEIVGPDDTIHMNALYGRVYLEALFATLRKVPQSHVD